MLGSNFEFLFARTFLGYYLKSHFFLFFFFHVLIIFPEIGEKDLATLVHVQLLVPSFFGLLKPCRAN